MPIEVGVIKKDFFWRVRELIGSVCESFASGNIFFVFGGSGKEWMRKHSGERIRQNEQQSNNFFNYFFTQSGGRVLRKF
jgi:hypothetical protein